MYGVREPALSYPPALLCLGTQINLMDFLLSSSDRVYFLTNLEVVDLFDKAFSAAGLSDQIVMVSPYMSTRSLAQTTIA